MNIATLIAILPVLGVIAGLLRVRYSRAPYIAAGVVVVAYGLYIGSLGIWAATCWDCRAGFGSTRADGLYVNAIFFGLIAVPMLLGIWLGARMVTMLQRLRRTWRELRGKPVEENSDAVSQ